MTSVVGSDAAPELVELLQAMVTLFPDSYPSTRKWLGERGTTRTSRSAPARGGRAKPEPSTPCRQTGADKSDKPLPIANRKERAATRERTAKKIPAQPPSKQPSRPRWPSVPREARRMPNVSLPANWANSHDYGLRLQFQEEQDLVESFARKLGFPNLLAGRMGVLIKFVDTWETAGGQMSLAVYHPREKDQKFTLVEVTRNDRIEAQFEVPNHAIDGHFITALLPVEWRKRS
jgi:hypothetical protein